MQAVGWGQTAGSLENKVQGDILTHSYGRLQMLNVARYSLRQRNGCFIKCA
jgi:hypothetical protein